MRGPLQKFSVLGILNLTPDSFSDGGLFNSPEKSLSRFKELLAEGADFVDIGAESTRPGSHAVSITEEWARLEPLLSLLKTQNLLARVSVDTRKFSVMRKVASLGVAYINCVGPIPDHGELEELHQLKPDLCFIATHVHGTPDTMQLNPLSSHAAHKRINAYFESCVAELMAAGFPEDQIFLDPGIGFGKTDAANWSLLLNLTDYTRRYNVAIGISRKGFIQRSFGAEAQESKDQLSKLIECQCVGHGASLIRTHNVKSLVSLSNIWREALA